MSFWMTWQEFLKAAEIFRELFFSDSLWEFCSSKTFTMSWVGSPGSRLPLSGEAPTGGGPESHGCKFTSPSTLGKGDTDSLLDSGRFYNIHTSWGAHTLHHGLMGQLSDTDVIFFSQLGDTWLSWSWVLETGVKVHSGGGPFLKWEMWIHELMSFSLAVHELVSNTW